MNQFFTYKTQVDKFYLNFLCNIELKVTYQGRRKIFYGEKN